MCMTNTCECGEQQVHYAWTFSPIFSPGGKECISQLTIQTMSQKINELLSLWEKKGDAQCHVSAEDETDKTSDKHYERPTEIGPDVL